MADFCNGGGIAPTIDRLDIENLQKERIISFGNVLLGGTPVRRDVKEMLTLVVLLRHRDVKSKYPAHELVHKVEQVAQHMNNTVQKFEEWQDAVHALFIKENTSSLSLHQVSNCRLGMIIS